MKENSLPNDDPEILYHYCSNAAFCSIIQNKSIWLSSLSQSNDSMEGRWLRSIFQQACFDSAVKDRHVPDIMQSFDHLIEMSDSLGFCLSEQSDLLSQWRGYADDAAGVCIGFSFPYLKRGRRADEENNASGYSLQKVIYGTQEQPEYLKEVIKHVEGFSSKGAYDRPTLMTLAKTNEEQETQKKLRTSASFPILLLICDLFKVKNPAFSEEREWRLMSISPRNISNSCKYRSAGSKIIPYREFPLERMDEFPIVEIVLGPKNTSNEKDIANLLLANEFENVVVKRSAATYR